MAGSCCGAGSLQSGNKAASSSAAVSFCPGGLRLGSRLANGSSTKRRTHSRGWGNCSWGLNRFAVPHQSRSKSKLRGPQATKRCLPAAASSFCSSASNCSGLPSHCSNTTALRKAGWPAGPPTGAVRNRGEQRRDPGCARAPRPWRAAPSKARQSPKLLPRAMAAASAKGCVALAPAIKSAKSSCQHS